MQGAKRRDGASQEAPSRLPDRPDARSVLDGVAQIVDRHLHGVEGAAEVEDGLAVEAPEIHHALEQPFRRMIQPVETLDVGSQMPQAAAAVSQVMNVIGQTDDLIDLALEESIIRSATEVAIRLAVQGTGLALKAGSQPVNHSMLPRCPVVAMMAVVGLHTGA